MSPAAASISQPSAALFPDATKISPSTDNGPKLAGGAEQPTEPDVPASMPPLKNIDQPKAAETSAMDNRVRL